MAHPWYHSLSHAKRFGGVANDYTALNCFVDQTKAFQADCRHRLLLHNAWGIFIAERRFGLLYTRASDGVQLPTRPLVEQHVFEDLGSIPSVAQCLAQLPEEPRDEGDPAVYAAAHQRHFGGPLAPYLAVHTLLDSTRAHLADRRHQRLLHNTWGIELVVELLGARCGGASTREIAQLHVLDDCGRIPSVDECLAGIAFAPWMCRGAQRLSQSLGQAVAIGKPTVVTTSG